MPGALVAAFQSPAARTESRREKIAVESRALATLRDILLPKLMSGELSVGNAVSGMEKRE